MEQQDNNQGEFIGFGHSKIYQTLIGELFVDNETSTYLKILGRDDKNPDLISMIHKLTTENIWTEPGDDDGFFICYSMLQEEIKNNFLPKYFEHYFTGCDDNTHHIIQWLFDWIKHNDIETIKGLIGFDVYLSDFNWFYGLLCSQEYYDTPFSQTPLEVINLLHHQDNKILQETRGIFTKLGDDGKIIKGLINIIYDNLIKIKGSDADSITTVNIGRYNLFVVLANIGIFTNIDFTSGNGLKLIDPVSRV